MGIEAQQIIENPGASQEAIEFHYDTSNEFFSLWLDPTMTYSGALFEPGDDLETAQRRKVDHHIREAGAIGAQRLLDIGCGWGSTILRATHTHGARSAVGLTLSPSQAEHIRLIGADNAVPLDIQLCSWSDHKPDAPYDAIISIGAIEHFARPNISQARKIQGYRDFFDRCHQWMEPGKQLSLQSVLWDKLDRSGASKWLVDEVYPETDLPELSDLLQAAKGRFSVEKILFDREGYIQTLNVWRRNLRHARPAAVEVVGEETVNRFDRYLAICAVAFFTKNITLGRMTFKRID